MESAQRRATRCILKDFNRESSATALLKKLDLESLQERRKIDKAVMVYRIVNDLVDIPSGAHFSKQTGAYEDNKANSLYLNPKLLFISTHFSPLLQEFGTPSPNKQYSQPLYHPLKDA